MSMSIYSDLSLLFKLSHQLKELKEYDEIDKNDIYDIKELAENFIDNCTKILNVTHETNDEEFMIKSFLNSNFDLLDWIFKNHCPKIKQNYLQNLLFNLKNENYDQNYTLNNIKQIKNKETNNDKNESNEENKKNKIKKMIDTHDTIKLIEVNKDRDKNLDMNIKVKNVPDFNKSNNDISNNICDKQTNEVDNSDIINEEKEMEKEEISENYEEEMEEEEEEDDDKSENHTENGNNNFINYQNKENNKMNENKIMIINENKDKSSNDIKDTNHIFNNEEKKDEEKHKVEIENEKKIQEKKLNDITSKAIKDYFELFISTNNENRQFNDIFMVLNDLKNNYNTFERNSKEKILTLLCTIYPFCSTEQKKKLNDINIKDENIRIFLFKTLLYFEGNNNLYKILTCIPTKKRENFEINKNLFINSKSELIALYQFLIIYKSFGLKIDKDEKKTFDKKYSMMKFYFISFKIYFILSNVELFSLISNSISDIYERLLFIKKFYSSAFIKKIEEPYITSQINQFKEEFKKYSLNDIKDKLFDEDEKIVINKIFQNLKHFYRIDEKKGSDLLYHSNNKIFERINLKYNFIENFTDIIYIKYNLIDNKAIKRIKDNLTCLEKNIRHITLENCNERSLKNSSCYSIRREIKNSYYSLILEIKEGLKIESSIDVNKIKFYPLTLFFPFSCYSSLENELIIFFDVTTQKYHSKIDILIKLEKFLKKKYKLNKKYDSENIKLNFNYKGLNVTIVFLGYPLYIQTIIFREYSLLDQRFPILILTLNYFLNKIGLVGINMNQSSNFFCLSLQYLLISFLQDIINPPILPKLLTQDILNIQKIPCQIEIIANNINSIIYKCLHIPKIIFERQKIKSIYNKQIKNNQNKLTCSEIFLKFLEFIIYYFKFDTIYSDLSNNYEGFNSINNILRMYDNEEVNNFEKNINPNDLYFMDYFYNKYSQNKEENIILIKSIVNPFNNIFLLKNIFFKNFYEKIKKGYEILINSGSFDDLDKKQKNKS